MTSRKLDGSYWITIVDCVGIIQLGNLFRIWPTHSIHRTWWCRISHDWEYVSILWRLPSTGQERSVSLCLTSSNQSIIQIRCPVCFGSASVLRLSSGRSLPYLILTVPTNYRFVQIRKAAVSHWEEGDAGRTQIRKEKREEISSR